MMKRTLILAMAVLCAVALTTIANAEILQPGPDPDNGKDSTVMYNSSKPERNNWNLGGSSGMYVGAYGTVRRHSFIEFDLSGISTAPGDIASVKLSLLDWYYANIGTNYDEDRDLGLYQVTSTWDEGPGVWNYVGVGNEVTYNNQPSFNSTPVATITMPAGLTEALANAGGVWHVWDSNDPGNSAFVDLVKGWAAGSIDNFGLAVMLTEPNDTTYSPYHNYRTSDYLDDASLRPMLEITPVPEPGCVVLLLCGMASLLLIARRRR